ncbi:MAG: cyclic nucleotide-binding domain-containing protein [Planctomycetota bacterium]|nr:cyclic nucleotide-binding domain-containing protein [Planctomycetota bacterium]
MAEAGRTDADTATEAAEEPAGRLSGDVLSLEDMQALPVFEGCSAALLKKNVGAVVRRTCEPGEIICREGEYGSTAFYVLEGEAEVFIASPLAHAQGSPRSGGLFGRALTFLTSFVRRSPEEADEETSGFIPIDASIDLSMDDPVGALGESDLFGEMTCMSFYPRSATVRAKTRVVVLEMLRNILDILKRGSKPFKEQLERNYRERALENHLRSVGLLKDLPADFVDHLRERVELVSFKPGDVICKQGDEADKFWIIRLGFVKVSQEGPGGEVVLKYLHRSKYFGEMGLLGAGKRQATCTALDHVELVQLGKEDFTLMMERFPEVRAAMQGKALRHEGENRRRLEMMAQAPVDEFLEQGLMQARNLLLIDLEKCTRCDDCVRACANSHDGITRLIRDGLRFDKYLVPTSCRSCHDPLCMIGCPVGSIRRRETLEIVIEDWCIGCSLCAKNCPYGNINMHTIEDPVTGEKAARAKPKMKAVTCDLCASLGEPACVYACPHEAAMRVDPSEFFLGMGEQDR